MAGYLHKNDYVKFNRSEIWNYPFAIREFIN